MDEWKRIEANHKMSTKITRKNDTKIEYIETPQNKVIM